ncbi:MAG: FAD-dependent oxidoreductase [Holosporales bacterium]
MTLKLNDLKNFSALSELHQQFMAYVQQTSPELFAVYTQSCGAKGQLLDSEQLMKVAIVLENFLSEKLALHSLRDGWQAEAARHARLATFKKKFIQKYAIPRYPPAQARAFHGQGLEGELAALLGAHWSFSDLADQVLAWLQDEKYFATQLDLAARYVAWRSAVAARVSAPEDPWVQLQQKLDFNALLSDDILPKPRDGFNLTDPGPSSDHAANEAQTCLKCHQSQKDSCRTGLSDGDAIKRNALGNLLSGCPLQQKISEMITLYQGGHRVAAFAVAMLDNPFLALTGHRICNDCAKACVFQKQTPVDIPGVESRILKEVLTLPWGLEIYHLLAWWNPLNTSYPLPKDPTGKTVLVVGQGPAGIAMSYYLLREGHTVIAIEGLKVDPLPDAWLQPQKFFRDLAKPLEQRDVRGFGGVAEYGITARWDKNQLIVMRILLERQQRYRLFDGVRLGSQLTLDQAFSMGIHHVVLATGAGAPVMLDVPGIAARGVRFAADFLMNLHLNQAHDVRALMALQVRLPIVVVGAGLTAVDAACEALAYYVRMVERVVELVPHAAIMDLTAEERDLLDLYLHHGTLIQQERQHAAKENRPADFSRLLQSWGGCTVLYHKAVQQAPSYRLNHEELRHALAEGVQFLSDFSLSGILADNSGHVRGIEGQHQGKNVRLPAGTVLIAIGTQHREARPQDPRITVLGDANPLYAGSVVKALASAKALYSPITERLAKGAGEVGQGVSFEGLDHDFRSYVRSVTRLSEKAVEVVVHAPAAARQWRPGQFFKLQNYAADARAHNGFKTVMEPVALTACWVDRNRGDVGLVVVDVGVSTHIVRQLQPGARVVLMGPIGAPARLSQNATVALIGGGLGATAVLLPIAEALKQQGCRVFMALGYESYARLPFAQRLERAADRLLISYEEGTPATGFQGRITDALSAFAATPEGEQWIGSASSWMVCGSVSMMAACRDLFMQGSLASLIKQPHAMEASLNNPMQCMMQGICGSCIQRLYDPVTGDVQYRFVCTQQDQPLRQVDMTFLSAQLKANHLMEKLTYAVLCNRAAQGSEK